MSQPDSEYTIGFPVTTQTATPNTKAYKWDPEYVIDNLPAWIYTEYKQPEDQDECQAKIDSLNWTVQDIDLQIEIRELESSSGFGKQTENEFKKWKAQALRAKQTHMYLLNAYTYWQTMYLRNKIRNTTFDYVSAQTVKELVTELVTILHNDGPDIIEELEQLLAKCKDTCKDTAPALP